MFNKFLRKPNEKNLTSKARILKLGKTLSVGDVLIYSEDIDEPVAQCFTYIFYSTKIILESISMPIQMICHKGRYEIV